MTAHALASRPAHAVALRVETAPLDEAARLIPLLDASRPLVWMRKGDGIAGIGEALRLEFTGTDRIRDAAKAWQQIVADATVHDAVHAPGSGLVAFGAFSFAASSAVSSVLIVPSVIVGRHAGRSWLTRITPEQEPSADQPGSNRSDASAATATAAAHKTDAAADTHEGPRRAASALFGRTADALRGVRGDRPRGADHDQPAASACPQVSPLGAEYRIALLPGAMPPDAYRDAVRTAVERIRRGDFAKVVLARDVAGHLPQGSDLRRPLSDLGLGYPQCWTYAVDGLIGSSPETLITVHDGALTARVLAGTASRGADAAADHQNSETLGSNAKDHQEHEYAVQSVLQTLRTHTRDLASSELPFALKLPNLWHLATDVTGTLADGSTVLDLVSALHPTAAVAGTPTPDAVAAIEELEPFDRGRYAGPVGWVDADGDGEWAIALRGAQVSQNGDITAFAGCGIVAGSDPDAELAESTMKLRPVVETFG